MNRILAVILPLMAVMLASCQGVAEPPIIVGADVKLPDTDSAAYLDSLSSRPRVTESEAINGMLMAIGQKPQATFARAVAALRDGRIVDAGWDFQADRNITRGKVAYMAFQACGLKGGLTLQLTGPSGRYCLKELQYRGLMGPGTANNTLTGLEYLAVLGRIDEYRQTGSVAGARIREGGQQ